MTRTEPADIDAIGSMPDKSAIEDALAGTGMVMLGQCRSESGELDNRPGGETMVLVGNAGSAMWRAFATSRICHDGRPDPLDRWTRAVIDPAARNLGSVPIFPFDRPHPPFQRWALRTGAVSQSPIGLLIHPVYGLWHAYRAALLFTGTMAEGSSRRHVSPCEDCQTKPCLDTCPVNAFSHKGYDVPACADHLAKPTGILCREGGCAARNACPAGRDYRYPDNQIRFHMNAFRRAVVPADQINSGG